MGRGPWLPPTILKDFLKRQWAHSPYKMKSYEDCYGIKFLPKKDRANLSLAPSKRKIGEDSRRNAKGYIQSRNIGDIDNGSWFFLAFPWRREDSVAFCLERVGFVCRKFPIILTRESGIISFRIWKEAYRFPSLIMEWGKCSWAPSGRFISIPLNRKSGQDFTFPKIYSAGNGFAFSKQDLKGASSVLGGPWLLPRMQTLLIYI